MITSRFQLGLIATLAVGLGFSLASSDANGYPAGPAVSLGTNPAFSNGGIVSSSADSITTASTGQQMVITDVVLTMATDSCSSQVDLRSSTGAVLGTFKLHSSFTNNNGWGRPHRTSPTQVSHSFGTGLPLSAGDSIEVVETGGCGVAYTLSGYYAQP
jgi:hypothetical protein